MPNIVSVEFQSLDLYNLAIHNNNIPLIDEIIIKNDSDYILKNLEVEISSAPSFFTSFITKISEISSGRYIIINKHNLDIDTTKIMYSSQPVSSLVTVKIKNMGEVLAESSKTVSLLPYDYIPPVYTYTELLSSYVTPMQDEVKNIALTVVEKLKENPNVPANRDMWNYSDTSMVKAIAKTIYDTVRELKITLNTTNVFNENRPIQIKLPEITVATRSGNGFEIALLTASVAEFLGINPFIVFTPEKTLIGMFYIDNCFETCVSDDGRAFTELVDGECNRFCVIDTTSMMNGTQVHFANSLITAQKAINAYEYPVIVDIHRSRISGYNSIPNRVRQSGNLIFEMSVPATKRGEREFDTSVLKSSQTLSAFMKNNILSSAGNCSLSEIDAKKSIYLIGSAKYILSKLFFNGKITLKSFPFSNVIDDNSDFLEKLVQLNSNIDSHEMSSSVNVFHEKESLNKRMLAILNNNREEFTEICLSLGTVSYLYNGVVRLSPLFIVPISFEADSATSSVSIKLLTSEITLNTALTDILNRSGIRVDFSGDLPEKYNEITSNLASAFKEADGFKFFDTVAISVFAIDGQNLSSIATAEFFEKSEVLNKLFGAVPFENKSTDKEFSLFICDVPFSLDSTQVNAVKCAKDNELTVIKGANGSGKTRVAASIAFSEIREGKKVLYFTNSDGNARDFMQLAHQSSFDDYVMFLSDKSQNVNTFDKVRSANNSISVADELAEKTELLTQLVAEQNSYYENLHKVNEIGFSLYEAASQYERYRSFPYSVNFTNSDISTLTRDDVVTWFDAVSSISKAGADCKEPFSNPLSFVKEKNFSYDLKSRATIALSSHVALTQSFISLQNQLAEFFGVEVPMMKEKQTSVILEMLECVKKENQSIYYGIFGRPTIESDFAKLEAMVLQCDDLFELKDFLSENFTTDVISFDCDALLAEWRNANSKFAFSRSSALSSVKNKLKAYALNPKFISNENFVDVVTKISRYRNAISLAEENASLVHQVTGIDIKAMIFSNCRDVFARIKEIITVSQKYLALITELYDSEQAPNTIYLHQSNLFKNTEKLANDIELYFSDFAKLYQEYTLSEQNLVSLLNIDIARAKEENNKLWYYFVSQFLNRMLDNIDLLKYWCNWNVEKEKAISLGLVNVIKLYEGEQITSSDIKNAFLKGFFKSVTEYFLSCETSVSSFSSDKQKEKMSRIYYTLDLYRTLLARDLAHKVNSSLAEFSERELLSSLTDSEMLLKKNFAYEFSPSSSKSAVTLLQQAKPCFVCMSTKFLTKFKNLPSFDTIIIDCNSEKLQYSLFMLLPLAKKVVIIDTTGDSEKFNFASLFESRGVPVAELGWLYNVNFASQLVNELFYQNSLSSFVCTDRRKNGVNVIHQIGTYDRKKTRVNVIEASAVIDEIIKLKSEKPDLSVGVYTMTDEQRALIETLFYKRIGSFKNPKDENDKENFFIRNFTQGEYDPRDVIIFSTAFSAEERPKYKDTITKALPELSKSSSVNNLVNVFSSARVNFTLITSLSVDILEKFKTTERNYCIFKKAILRLITENTTSLQDANVGGSGENSIVREVANHIESLGYKADLNISINKCKIDIAVKNKGKSHYLLGIVFDESAYINSDDFFGRDLILSGLETLGKWKILRIYTVEWFENHTKQLDYISSALNGNDSESDFSISQYGE